MRKKEKIIIMSISAPIVAVVLLFSFTNTFGGGDMISEEEAIAIAEEHTGGTATDVVVEKEWTKTIYEVTVDTDKGIAEIEIDAETGEVLEVEYGEDDD